MERDISLITLKLKSEGVGFIRSTERVNSMVEKLTYLLTYLLHGAGYYLKS
jgi:hypothetical protein